MRIPVPPRGLIKMAPDSFDGPESLGAIGAMFDQFCATVPTLPSLYNNYKRIVQTEDYVMICKKCRLRCAHYSTFNSEHSDPNNRSWLGDSVGQCEGDTLVVKTKNFKEISGLGGADENQEVEERFSLTEDGNLLYDFTVVDDTVWTAPWSGEYIWIEKPKQGV